MSTLDRAAILRLIPHADAMCLLDGAQSWNDAEISCIYHTLCTAGQSSSPGRRQAGRILPH